MLGNLKFDAQLDAALLARGRELRRALGRPVIALAVSREGEEAELLRICKEKVAEARDQTAQSATKTEANPLWLIVPRHPQRFDEVAALAAAQGLAVSRRSGWAVDADRKLTI